MSTILLLVHNGFYSREIQFNISIFPGIKSYDEHGSATTYFYVHQSRLWYIQYQIRAVKFLKSFSFQFRDRLQVNTKLITQTVTSHMYIKHK